MTASNYNVHSLNILDWTGRIVFGAGTLVSLAKIPGVLYDIPYLQDIPAVYSATLAVIGGAAVGWATQHKNKNSD